MYVASFYIFEPQLVAHDFDLFVVPSECTWRRSISLNHNCRLTISASSLCHQTVCGVVLYLSTTIAGSRFRPLRCAIREYVASFYDFEPQLQAHDFGLFVVPSDSMWCRSISFNHNCWLTISTSSLCHKGVRGVVL